MADGKFVAYYRVSTAQQGHSGLGLDAQREAVMRYLSNGGWPPLAEFTEIETGKGANALDRRPQLQAALAFAYEQLALRRWDALTVLSTSAFEDGRATVRLNGPHGPFDVTVLAESVAAEGLTCKNPGPNLYRAFQPVRIVPVEA